MHRFKRVVLKFFSSQGNLFRYSSSFCMLLGLLPGLIIVLRIFQNEILNNPKLVEFLYWYLPKELISPFIEYVLSKDYDTYLSLIISMGLSIYLASNAIYSFMLISKDDEGFDTYNILIRIKAIIMFISLIIGLILLAFINYFTRSIIVIEIGFFSLFYFFYRFLSFEKKQPESLPEHLEAGSLPIELIASLQAAIKENKEKNFIKEQQLTTYFIEEVNKINNVNVLYPNNKNRCPIVSLHLNNISSDEIMDRLFQEYKICSRGGIHCAPLLHQQLHTENCGLLRFSFSNNNTLDEVKIAIKALKQIMEDV